MTTRVTEIKLSIEEELFEIWLKAGGFLHKIEKELSETETEEKFKNDIAEIFNIFDINSMLSVNIKHQIEHELSKRFEELRV